MPELERGMVVNETDLPDDVVADAVIAYFEENASVLGANQGTTFQTYANEGSLLARSKFRVPRGVIEEIILARDLAERDDDVAATIGSMIAVAFEDGMQNTHADEITIALYNEAAKHANLDAVFPELYRELLISSSLTTVSLFTRESFQFQPEGADRQRTRGLVAPLIGVLPAEQIRITDNDLFGTGTLAYKPASGAQERWLREYFSSSTSPARKAEMRRDDPVLTTLLLDQLDSEDDDYSLFFAEYDDPNLGANLYRLNPRMVHRSTFPKGAWKYPRPLLTRNFALLEAKRLLNLMDYALLQGGSNFLVVAKKGSDQLPAHQAEVDNLREIVKRASRTGVIVGDHRLTIEIITPKLDELLSPAKRRLIGRKLAMALLRVPEHATDQPAAEGMRAEVEFLTRVITHDRRMLRRHVERYVYEELVKRNPGQFPTGAANIWFPKIILQGSQFFTDYILKMRDRGDIPRRYAVEAGGFDYDAAVQQRKREKAAGDDRVMTPAAVPFSSPNAGGAPGPQDNAGGRPRGSSPNNGSGAPNVQRPSPSSARPTQVIARNAGETVRAMYEEELGSFRVGELTYAILEEYADTKTLGRLTRHERAALEAFHNGQLQPFREGPLTVIPVNVAEDLDDCRVVRLSTGVAMIVGDRDDRAMMARALCFREPEYSPLDAQETALRWGWDAPVAQADDCSREEHAAATTGMSAAPMEFHIHASGEERKPRLRLVHHDDQGRISSIEEVDAEPPEET